MNTQGRLITIKCDYCGKEFQKPLKEYKRCQERKRYCYCSRECSIRGVSLQRSLKPYKKPSEKMLKHLAEMVVNQRDEYTPFRYTYRSVKRRFKEVDITLDDLKEQWEKQNGTCPFTGFKLILPHDSNIHEIDFFHRASLDRIDSALGYVKGNIQFVSTPINLMKSTKSDEEIKKFLKEISEFTSHFILKD